jgi:polygalacturonase
MLFIKKFFLILFLVFSCFAICSAQSTYSSQLVFNIKNYGATGNGRSLDTKAINDAIADCVKNGGGTVYVPAGTFVTGSFQLFSNINLYLDAGAVILASKDTGAYFYEKDYGFNGIGAGERTGVVFAHDAQNVSITGQGTIDGNGLNFMYKDSLQYGMDFDKKYTRQGDEYMDQKYGRNDGPILWKGDYSNRPGIVVIFSSCKKVSVTGITIKDAGNWSMAFLRCDDSKVQGISIKNNMDIPNSDGIDSYNSKNLIISDCDIRAGDDAIAISASSNVTVTNCNLTSRSSGIRVGYNVLSDDSSGNLLFNNIRIYGSNRGIGIFQRVKGNMENIVFSNMIIDTRLHSGQWWGHGEPIHISALPGNGSKEVGEIKNVRFVNIIAKGEEGIVLYGSKESMLKNISFDNVQLTITKGKLTDSYGGNFDLRPATDISLGIFKHDIPGLFAKNINGLFIKDLQVDWEEKLPGFFSNAIQCEDFQQLTIDGFRGNAASINKPVISLTNGKDASINNAKATHKGSELLFKENVSGLEISGKGIRE